MIEFRDVSKEYKQGVAALQDINLKIEQGEFIHLLGHSGSGKTSILKLITAEEKPSNGEVLFHGIDIHKLGKESLQKYRQRIGVVFQDLKLIRNKTVYENIAFVMEMLGRDDEEIATDVPYVLKLVHLEERINHFPDELSGGEQQRLALARAIVNQPEIILADEPADGLDQENFARIIHILKKVHELGATVILSSHHQKMLHAFKERVIVMDSGKIVQDYEKGQYHKKHKIN